MPLLDANPQLLTTICLVVGALAIGFGIGYILCSFAWAKEANRGFQREPIVFMNQRYYVLPDHEYVKGPGRRAINLVAMAFCGDGPISNDHLRQLIELGTEITPGAVQITSTTDDPPREVLCVAIPENRGTPEAATVLFEADWATEADSAFHAACHNIGLKLFRELLEFRQTAPSAEMVAARKEIAAGARPLNRPFTL